MGDEQTDASVFEDIQEGDTYGTKGRTLTEADVVKNQDGDTVLSCEMLSLLR